MAVITCVFNYNENTGKVDLATHVMTIDEHDRINFVTQTPGLVLLAQKDFPILGLKQGDHAPVRYTTETVDTKGEGVREFKVYYHGPIGSFACGELDGRNTFQAWSYASGVEPPDSSTGR